MIPDQKLCPKCQETKPSSEYHIRKDRGYTYLKSYCKQCANKLTTEGQYDVCQCGQQKTKKSKLCLDCHNKQQCVFNTLGEVKHYGKKYGKQSMFQPIRSRARSIIKDKHRCEKCGYDKHVEACHIKPISSFSDDTPIDVINSPENILALCPNCHWEFDNIK